MARVRMPAPLSTSSCPPSEILSSSLTPPTSAARAVSEAQSKKHIARIARIVSLQGNAISNHMGVGAALPGSREAGHRRGAAEPGRGAYKTVREQARRAATKYAARSRELDGFENSRGAHTGAYAHRNHTVLLLAPAQTVHDRCGAHRAGRAQRVTERNRTAQRIDPRRVEPELLDDGEALRGEGFVQFDPADLILLDAGPLEHLRNCSDWANTHHFGRDTADRESDPARERREAKLLQHSLADEDRRPGAIRHLRTISRSHR